jgi:hypothetical protein
MLYLLLVRGLLLVIRWGAAEKETTVSTRVVHARWKRWSM